MNTTTTPPDSRAHNLPSELWDRVIDHLHDDKDALKQASLVCKAWTPSSHFHLFYNMLYAIHRRVTHLIDLVAIAPLHVAASVRSLQLVGPGAGTLRLRDARTVFKGLPNLDTLKIFMVKMGAHWGPLPLPPPAMPIRHLEVVACSIPESVFLDFLSIFPSIDHLELDFLDLSERIFRPAPDLTSPVLSLLAIRELAVRQTPMAFIHRIVYSTRAAKTMESLVLNSCVITWEEVDNLGEMLAALRSTLRRLHLHPLIVNNSPSPQDTERQSWKPGPLWERMNLSKCDSLETLDLIIYDSRHPDSTLRLVAVYLAAVEVVPRSLRALNIYLMHLPPSYDMPFDSGGARSFWDSLDRMIVVYGPPDMQIALEIHELALPEVTKADADEFTAFIVERLPRAVAQGRLRVMQETILRLDVNQVT